MKETFRNWLNDFLCGYEEAIFNTKEDLCNDVDVKSFVLKIKTIIELIRNDRELKDPNTDKYRLKIIKKIYEKNLRKIEIDLKEFIQYSNMRESDKGLYIRDVEKTFQYLIDSI